MKDSMEDTQTESTLDTEDMMALMAHWQWVETERIQ